MSWETWTANNKALLGACLELDYSGASVWALREVVKDARIGMEPYTVLVIKGAYIPGLTPPG